MTREQKAQNYVVPSREPEGEETAEQVEQERQEEQERINNGELILGETWLTGSRAIDRGRSG